MRRTRDGAENAPAGPSEVKSNRKPRLPAGFFVLFPDEVH